MEEFGQLAYGAGAVRNGVFLFGGHLGEGFRVAVGHEQRVVAESLVSGLAVDDLPFDDAFEQVLLAAEKQRNDRPEPCAAVFGSFEVPEQQTVVGREVVAVGGVTGRMYARGAAERFDFESRVVGEAVTAPCGRAGSVPSARRFLRASPALRGSPP